MRERDLYPAEAAEILCPECGESLNGRDDIYTLASGDTVMGCSRCLHPHNAAEWYGEWQETAELLAKNYQDDSFAWGQ
ncbi:hypothetical protein LJC61_03915 [Ruminococcaceae bacterium OttesenSCG-928-A16]|nr:hypothetical protein [Ruminococcaceae bacterium OttesenSCG-928-A16]